MWRVPVLLFALAVVDVCASLPVDLAKCRFMCAIHRPPTSWRVWVDDRVDWAADARGGVASCGFCSLRSRLSLLSRAFLSAYAAPCLSLLLLSR